ncbi:MAG: permease [Clostridia bacterium]|nr:permease [Clostridia bacterium]
MPIANEIVQIFDLVMIQFKLIFPYWIAGTIAGSIISVFLSSWIKTAVSKLNFQKYRLDFAILAAVLGVVSPMCMYGTIPMIAVLGRKGVPQYILATFMVSSILLNPNLFLLSFALGTPIAILRMAACLLAGLCAGMLVKVFYKDKQLFNYENFEERKKTGEGQSGIKRLGRDLNKSITITAPYFLTGILLTALFDLYFPKDLIVAAFSSNKGFGVLLAASLGVPVYLCGGGTIPLIRVWLQAGISPGSAVAFMITGPATKLTNLSAVKILLGFRNFIFYIVFNIVFAIAAGLFVDILYRIRIL